MTNLHPPLRHYRTFFICKYEITILFLTSDVNAVIVASHLQLRLVETLKIGSDFRVGQQITFTSSNKAAVVFHDESSSMTCADLTKTTMAGEWRLNPRVLRAKGDRSVLERYLSATMITVWMQTDNLCFRIKNNVYLRKSQF